MGASREELRRAVGRALRSFRQGWRLSLDDVEQASATMGVRITRSHLSRVENGQADLALPRFLCLMRAVGEPPADVVESLDGLLDQDAGAPGDLHARAAALLERGEPAAAAHLLRQAARSTETPLPRPALECWAHAEAAIGRWSAAAAALRRALAPLGETDAHLLLTCATASLGAGQPGVALPLVRAAGESRLATLIVECCCLLESAAQADTVVVRIDQHLSSGPPLPRALALIVKSEFHRRRGQLRAAARLAAQAREIGAGTVAGVEAGLALARAESDAGRRTAGLAALDDARRLARESSRPDLLARCHREAERIWTLLGDRDAARQAQRAARAIWRRHAADRQPPRSLPLHGLMCLADRSTPEGARAPRPPS